MLDILKVPILSFQEFFILAWQAFRNIFRRPRYWDDIFLQADIIGFGSLPVVVLPGFLSGAVLALQMSRALSTYGAQGQSGKIVAITLVREMGPILSALLVAGRNGSGIASELGSMKVTEQIDAMRALGTDPIQKLVTPRLIATAFVLPCLTVISDMAGIIGAWLVASVMLGIITSAEYWNTAYQALVLNDLAQGLLKPFLFALVIALVGCYYGMRTTGGTQGVGRSTTQAVVVACVWIIVVDLLVTQVFVNAS